MATIFNEYKEKKKAFMILPPDIKPKSPNNSLINYVKEAQKASKPDTMEVLSLQ